MTQRIFRYVVRYDQGVAPRPFDGYCSLAICKPRIRANAAAGDWVIGFRTCSPGDVIYVMQVEEVLSFTQYWTDVRFRKRRPHARSSTPDNIYRPITGGAVEQVPNHVHNVTDVSTDVGGRYVLVSQRFWYFGDASPMIPNELVHLIHTGRGHAAGKGRRPDDIEQLVQWLRSWPTGLLGEPVDRSLVAMTTTPQGRCQPRARKSSGRSEASSITPILRRCS